MAPTPTGQGRIRLLQACREGWIAFGKAPLPFLLFSLLSSLAMGACGVVGGLGVLALLAALQVAEVPTEILPRLLLMPRRTPRTRRCWRTSRWRRKWCSCR